MKEYKFKNVKFVGQFIILGGNVSIDENTVIHDNVQIDDHVKIGRNVSIYPDVKIGKGTTIEDNTIIGYRNLTSVWKEDEELNSTEIGEEVIVRPNCIIYTGCKIGDYSKINHNAILRELTIIGTHSSIGSLTKCEGYTRIGDFCSIHPLNLLSQFVLIEDYVFIGPSSVTISDQHMYYKRDAATKYKPKGPTIKFGARVGSNVTIMPDVIIGREALVRAGALVDEDIADFKIAHGVPARVVGDVPEQERLKLKLA